MKQYMAYIMEMTQKLLAIPSPTGYTYRAADFVKKELEALGYQPALTRKGAVLVQLCGGEDGILLAAHMDVLGAGGFLVTNYQKDMEDQFQDGEHLVIYYSAEDLIEKVGFYLKHEQERKRIAHNGHKLVGEEYTMDKLLSKMFQIAGITA